MQTLPATADAVVKKATASSSKKAIRIFFEVIMNRIVAEIMKTTTKLNKKPDFNGLFAAR